MGRGGRATQRIWALSPSPLGSPDPRVSPAGEGAAAGIKAAGAELRSLPTGDEGVLWTSRQGSFPYRRRSEGKTEKIKILVG